MIMGCDNSKEKIHSTAKMNSESMIKVNSYKVSDDSISISYTIKNIFKHHIWVCDGINSVGKCDIIMDGRTLYLRFFSSLPYDRNILLYFPPFAHYSKLPSNSVIERTTKINLPVKESDLSVLSNKRLNRLSATQIVLQIGYLTEEHLSKLDIWAKKESDEKAIVQIIRGIKVREEILEVSISDVKVPVSP